ncbi:hypothetical protein Sden_2402 [Shewanella denitrificans OS217]|jgi:hypothetical protein|uniref:DUF3955 domain-containing protein n=1 Tax=Shewanella denitrificans (strain OS217 / ATCC BAA-1090 / DSM 15013) TaxID=318161 RepID=Q12LJ4_SHEDO|nr:DUF3955 domain-containing protein [Shewanella denitrificans]ABE55682.1 hypothetical protein Sden_2402 [Shewanella denitrificans OS217]
MLASIIARLFRFKTALILFSFAALCWLAVNFIGSTVDSQGILHEPFFLVPIGWLFIFAGLFAALGASLRKLMTG